MRKKTLQELMKERANQSTDTSAYTEKEMPKSTQQRYIMPQEQSTWNKIQERANQILNNTFSTFSNNKNFTRFNYERQQHEDRLSGKYINNIQNNFLPTREGLKQQNQYFGKGNIDLNNRKIAKNEDGSISTVRSMSFYDDKEKKEILVPTVINGKVVSDDEAIDHYYNTGEYLGKFDTVKEANQYAENLHNEQEKQYSVINDPILARADKINNLYNKNIINRVSNKVSDTLQKTLQTPENLKNGYQFGDLSTTAMSTLLGGTAHAIEGVKSVGDAIANHGAYAVASVADITGNHDFSERLINAIQLNNEDTQNITQQINDIFDKSSVLGQTGNKALESFGQSKVFGILGQKSEALKEAGKIGQSKAMKAFADSLVYTMGANAGFDEAYNQANTTGWEAILKATGGGLSSYISENINDVFGYGGNKVTKNVKEKFENVFKSGMAKAFAKLGFSSISEGAEEIVEDFLNTKVVNNIVNKVIDEKKYNTEINLEDSIENAVIAMVSVWAGGTPATIQEGQYLNKQIQENKNRLSQIENSELNQNQKQKLLEISNKYDLSQKDIQDLIDGTKNGKYTENQATTMQNKAVLNQEQQTIQEEGKQAQNQLSQETDNIEQKVLNLRQSIDNYNNTRAEGQEIFDINNEETRKEIESIQKIAQDRNINIIFDENRFKNSNENAFYEYDKDNNVANIVLNPNSTSKKYVQNLVIHEMTHSFEGSKEYNNLSKAILDYAKSKGEYDSAFKDLMNTYSKVYSGENLNEIVEKEAVANILGEKLGDKEFVDSLVNNQYVERSTIQKIIDFVKNQINRFRGYKDQEQYWNNIKTLFEDAYNKSEVSKEGLKQSVETNNKISTKDSQGRELSKGQQEYFKNVSPELKDENGNLKRFYHGTNSDFTVFDLSKGGQSNSGGSIGFWFTETKEGAEKFANDVWYGDKKPNTKEVYLDIKNPKIYENVKNEEQEQFYKDKSEELEKKAKELKKKYSWDNTDYKTAMTFDSLIRDYHYARIKNESVDLDKFERLAEGRGFSKEQISEMKNDATEYDKIIAESKEAENEYYKLHYNDAYEQFKIDLYEVAGQSAEEANTGGLGMALNNPKETVEKFRQKLIAEGYDGIIIKRTQFDKDNFNGENNQYVIFNSNQAKNIDNTNPTTNPDIRFSQDTTGAWNNFIEKYFKNEGTGTAIKDMKKLPEMSITKYQEVLDNAKYIPQEEKTNLLQEVQNIKRNKSSLDEFKNLVNDMNNVYKEENTLNTKETYSTGRKEKYQKYLNSKTEYDNSALKNAMEIIPANNQGRRTKEQWLNVAKQIGTEIADKSNAEIEEIAFRTWQDERPSSKESMNRKGQKYVPFNSDDWVNAIYDSVNEQREKFSIETENQENKLETTQPVEQKEEKPSRKTLNPTEISNIKPEQASTTPELYSKQYKEGTKESEFAKNIENKVGFLTEEQKKEILKDDNIKYYAPVTNAETLGKAYQDLKENGQNATLEWYSKDGKTSSAEDVAKGWILLKQYADKGDTQGMVNVAKKLRDMGTKAGQTVQAFNILSRLTPEGMVAYTQGELQDAYNEMIKGKSKKWIDEHKSDFDLSQEEVAFIMDTMQNLPAENPDTNNYERKVALGQIQKLFTDKIPVEGGKIKAWMRISMLFNPKTQVRNVAGNVGIVPVNAVADFLGSKVDKAVAKKTGVRTLGNPNVKSYLKGAKQGLYQSYNDFRLGINTRGLEGSKFEFGEGKSFKDKGIGKALNRTENILNFVMDAGDRAFSQGSFTNSLNNQMVLNGVDTPTQEMIDIATQEALSRTWNDNNEYTNFVLGIRKGLNKIGTKNYGLGDVLIPFAKTPANLTKAIVDYSPVGLVNAIKERNNLKNAIETGQFTPMQQHKFVDSLGKALAGTMLYVIGYGLAKAGIATGEADEDKDVKNFMKNSLGIGSYSIKIGNKSFAYDWAQPVATPIAIMTNLYQTNKNNSDATILEKALNAVNIGTNQIMEQSFMDSLNEVLNGNGEITERLQKAVLDLPARAIPTFSKQIADLVDSTQRTSFEYGKPLQSSINAVKAKIPFASKTLTPVVDTLGNEVKRYGGENNVFNVFLNPANMNKGQLSKAGKEIYNVYMQTGDTTVFPVTAPYYVNYKGDKLTMTSQERADYQRISGKYTEEVMNKLLNNSNYKSLSDEDKAEIISKVVNDSNSKAKKDVLDIPNKDIDKIEKIGSNYYDYKLDTKKALDKKRQETGKTTTQLTDNEKISVLKNKNYSKKEKDLLYTNEIGDDDTVYTSMKLLNGNSLSFIDSYFDYKMGSKKSDDLKQFLNNNNQLTYMQKLYLTGVNNSSLNSTERQKLKNYIYSLNITEQQRKTMENKLKFTTEMKDGSYKWK